MRESTLATKRDRGGIRNFFFRGSLLCLGAPACVSAGSSETKCGLYLAPSSIPGAGSGVFAGDQLYRKGDIVGVGDIVIPIVELEWHNRGHHIMKYPFLWDEYTWHSEMVGGMEDEGEDLDSILVASPGIGAATNGYSSLANVDYNQGKLGRALSTGRPGVGAISPYNDRVFYATEEIPPAAEIFLK
jgi:hypothetical protein